MTTEKIYTELKSIREKLMNAIESKDEILIMFQVNNIDTLIYNLSLDLKSPKNNYPSWLKEDDVKLAVMFYQNGDRLEAIKYLRQIALPYMDRPLKWAKTFIESECNDEPVKRLSGK